MIGALIFSAFLTWVQVSSDTYVVKSSAGEELAKSVLKDLERFHQLLGTTLVFRDTELPELPIEVLLIGDEDTMRDLRPEYNGNKVSIQAFYQAGQDRDFIVISGLVYREALTSLVYHELTHYFVARGLESRPAWLNEGLAEYFSTVEIRDHEISLGALSPDRLQQIKAGPALTLKDFFAVDTSSPHYNESLKAKTYYAQAWAFMHYMMHGEHAQRFKGYLGALRKAEANLLEHLGVSERQLETGFQNYLRSSIQKSARQIVNVSGETWDMQVESIPDSEAQISIAEIFLANGKLTDARRHLEVLTATAPGSTRVSYYRGILARLAGDSAAREFFVDALLDPFLAPRAAVQLVAMGDSNIPAVRSILEEAASARTRTPEVYLALATIHQEEVRRIEESVRLNLARDGAAAPPAEGEKESIGRNNPAAPVVEWKSYMSGVADAGKVGYELLADSDRQPRVSLVLAPYYPAELLAEKASGEVVIDVQVGEDGKVGGIWVVSATPELFESLATSSVREWEFERIPAKIRVIVRFNP